MNSEPLSLEALRWSEVSETGLSAVQPFQKIPRDQMRMIVVETDHCSQILIQILTVIKVWSVIAFTISMRSDRAGQFIDLCCSVPAADAHKGILHALRVIKNVRYVAVETLPAN